MAHKFESQAGVTTHFCPMYHPRSKTPAEKAVSRDLKQKLKKAACGSEESAVIQLREPGDATKGALTSPGLSQNRGALGTVTLPDFVEGGASCRLKLEEGGHSPEEQHLSAPCVALPVSTGGKGKGQREAGG